MWSWKICFLCRFMSGRIKTLYGYYAHWEDIADNTVCDCTRNLVSGENWCIYSLGKKRKKKKNYFFSGNCTSSSKLCIFTAFIFILFVVVVVLGCLVTFIWFEGHGRARKLTRTLYCHVCVWIIWTFALSWQGTFCNCVLSTASLRSCG